jgi:hypothetical protein
MLRSPNGPPYIHLLKPTTFVCRPVGWTQREFCTPPADRNIKEELAKIVKQDKVVVFMKVTLFLLFVILIYLPLLPPTPSRRD